MDTLNKKESTYASRLRMTHATQLNRLLAFYEEWQNDKLLADELPMILTELGKDVDELIGFNPEYFTFRDKLIQLSRLIPFAENNYNFIELGPKGTGKSHVFSELSPHGILLSGGDVTEAKLFVNNASGKIGLVGFWDTVAFDEFAGSQKQVD